MSAQPAAARECLSLAASLAPAMLGRAIDHAVAAMQEEEQRSQEVARRQELADAWLELVRRRNDWSQRYATLLAEAQAASPETAATARTPHEPDRFGGLTLLDEDTLAHTIDSSRMLQLLAPRLEQPLAELDGLMSSALGLAAVQPERNPLRPEVFANALRDLMHPVAHPGWPRLWSQQLAVPLADEIAGLYQQALEVLRRAKVEAATYRVLPTASKGLPVKPEAPRVSPAGGGTGTAATRQDRGAPGASASQPGGGGAGSFGGGGSGGGGSGGSGGGGPGEAPGAAAAAAASAALAGSPGTGDAAATHAALSTTGPFGGAVWADLSNYQLGDELFQQFLFSRSQPSTQALAPAFYAQVDAQMASAQAAAPEDFEPYDAQTVVQHRALPPVERPHRPASTTRALDDAVWGRWAPARERSLHRSRLKKEAREVGQVLGLEVVRKLVDQVASDPRLLAPVREAIVALEPALLRLALVAPRFFSQEDHAGRRLVERVAERSFRYNDEFAADFLEFFGDVRTTFQSLNERKAPDEAPFEQALTELEERWSGEDTLQERGRRVAVDALHFAEAREAQAGQIAWGLSQRADLDGVPAVVQDFLYGPWSLVLAHARLTDPKQQMDPGGWNAIVSDLLWSVKPEQTLRDPARLFATIPGLLDCLRRGLHVLGQQPSEHGNFFAALEKMHRPVLKLRAKHRSSSPAPLEFAPALDPALLSTERQKPRAASGTPWLTPNELSAAGFENSSHSAPAPLESPAGAGAVDVASVIAGLHQGCWVDLHAHGDWRRASLSWVSGRATLFMFVSNAGEPHTMTRRSLERLVRGRLLRLVEAGAVVPRAIETLLRPRDSAPAPLAAEGKPALHEDRIAA